MTPSDADFEKFRACVERKTAPEDVPLADEIVKKIPIYAYQTFADAAKGDPKPLMSELIDVLNDGAGVIVIKQGIADHSIIDRATDVFEHIIRDESASGAGGGDHFAKPGANNRVWNAAEKHCLADSANFAAYYATDAIALPSRAWLGLGYQVTAQVNRVNPGGAAQVPHRDYHLGFMTREEAAAYPSHIHALSPVLTLQGAVAHCDTPVESGPTMLLPFSQTFQEGYLAFAGQEYQDYFAQHYVQMPLEKGDVLFFSPAVMHGAGNNVSSDIYRMANLLQVGSGFGRSIESVNRTNMVRALYPVLSNTDLSEHAMENVIAASAEGYPFPTNLDRDLPDGGLRPPSQADRLRKALAQGLSPDAFNALMDTYDHQRLT